jgi:hypothetical protein
MYRPFENPIPLRDPNYKPEFRDIEEAVTAEEVIAAIDRNNREAGFRFFSSANMGMWGTAFEMDSVRLGPDSIHFITIERGHFMNVKWVYAIRVYDKASHSVDTAKINGQSCAPYLSLADAYQDLDKLCPKS